MWKIDSQRKVFIFFYFLLGGNKINMEIVTMLSNNTGGCLYRKTFFSTATNDGFLRMYGKCI